MNEPTYAEKTRLQTLSGDMQYFSTATTNTVGSYECVDQVGFSQLNTAVYDIAGETMRNVTNFVSFTNSHGKNEKPQVRYTGPGRGGKGGVTLGVAVTQRFTHGEHKTHVKDLCLVFDNIEQAREVVGQWAAKLKIP